MRSSIDHSDTFECPHCGADVPRRAKMCRACGASDESGWDDDSPEGDWEPDDEFDYDSFVAREFPDQAEGTHVSHRNEWVKFVLVLVVISLLLSVILF